ncbi:MAG: transcriptional regulator [Candidatus Nealsonbacteria bacterium CG_4_10_14_0_2_um_filter_38_17]|uniref:Transcriptional regulator n=2 Tax=Candidatus Nealsoniibacteriota TaxID=1817911 RepID=A0A2M7UZ74_9BACT|nr:MAG: transcriptional regulator [Candidatus Nealsonbacteria bacterium CG23_combo_of_CG06-09_8_20_14_all_38_19]PIZ89266.1 MAG: transcriptional regulator [Candidatus Nealsonbacteria bacterium CG_4_10_14_0_2_um_filter_38_17]
MIRKKLDNTEKRANEFLDILQKISSDRSLSRDFLLDILSPTEYQEITTRWQIVKQLAKGIPQRKIAKNLSISVATVERGARELLDENGGFQRVLKILSKHK